VLALVACGAALQDAGITVTDDTRSRIGVVIGTTWGSLKAMSDYTKDSLLEEKPYFVEPARFPNTVMNCAAGQVAIRYGLKGANATIAGGRLAFLNVLDYAGNVVRGEHADTVLAGGVEEFTPHFAWADQLMGGRCDLPGEAAAMFVVERTETARRAGRRLVAEVLAVASAFAPRASGAGAQASSLAACVRRALSRAVVDAGEIAAVATCDSERADGVEMSALGKVFPQALPPVIAPRTRFGSCHAAMGAIQAAALLALTQHGRIESGRPTVITGYTEDGGVGAAVLRAWADGDRNSR